jgi:hypothetical protein
MIGVFDNVPPLGGKGKTLELSECIDGGPADEEDEDGRPDLSTMYGRTPDDVGIADEVASLKRAGLGGSCGAMGLPVNSAAPSYSAIPIGFS